MRERVFCWLGQSLLSGRSRGAARTRLWLGLLYRLPCLAVVCGVVWRDMAVGGVFAGWVMRNKKSRHRIGARCRLKSRLSLGGLAWMERSYFSAKL